MYAANVSRPKTRLRARSSVMVLVVSIPLIQPFSPSLLRIRDLVVREIPAYAPP